jgi:hypothetical protein
MVALTDETRPAWDLAALAAEHRDDLIGRVVAGFGPEEDLSDGTVWRWTMRSPR